MTVHNLSLNNSITLLKQIPLKKIHFAFIIPAFAGLLISILFLFSQTKIISPIRAEGLSKNNTTIPNERIVLAAVVTPIPTDTPALPGHIIFIPGYTPPSSTPVSVTKQPSITIPQASKILPDTSYSVAIIGDSMVDTMGERLEYLEHVLTRKYPHTQFHLYNYGIGSQNIEEGLGRFSSPFSFRDRTFPAISEIRPDVLIVASFAYNPLNPYDRNKHWTALTELVNDAKSVSPHVYVLAEIAPLINDFGKGPGGVNWPDPAIHAHHIIEGLENAEGIAKALHVGLIDAFAKSQVNSEKEGNKTYINTYDNIHPSIAGHEFMANLIANTIGF